MSSEQTTGTESRETDSERLQHLKLTLVPGIGPRIRALLLERFGTPEAIFAAAPSDLREVHGVGPKLCRSICTTPVAQLAEEELELCKKHNVRLLFDHEADYPEQLRQTVDPPSPLYVSGTILPQDAVAVAIVGSRHATHYGLTQAERLACGLARAGVTVVSGLARGIDAAAHRGALMGGGRTLAVLGSGLGEMYPPEHDKLAKEVSRSGAVLSEFPLRTKPTAGGFPQRNRIISGLSLGVLVVEASDRSGALITARHAAEQDRDVFAIPGRIDSRMSRGCHRLLREGAKLVETVEDILEELGPLGLAAPQADGTEVRRPAELLLNELEKKILNAIGDSATSVDEIVITSSLPTPQVVSTLTVLEMRKLVRRVSGFAYVRL